MVMGGLPTVCHGISLSSTGDRRHARGHVLVERRCSAFGNKQKYCDGGVGGASWRSAVVGQRGCGAASAYLIRSRPLRRKINSRACCYRGVRGRALTRAQHNIYSADTQTHTHPHTLTLGTTCTCTCLEGIKTPRCVNRYTAAEGKQVLG